MSFPSLIKSTLGDIPVVLEHQDFFVIEKPSGLACHGPDSENLASLLKQAQLPNKLCHRLDKDSSGLLIIAKHQQAADSFRRLFESKAIDKFYLALSHRKGKKKQGTIKGVMQKARNGQWKLAKNSQAEQEQGLATSHFYSFGNPQSDNAERVFLIKIIGGKTHQIRVAMKANASPILGDRLYGGQAAPRLMLHACALRFDFKGESIYLYSPASFISKDLLTHNPQLLEPEKLAWP